MGVGKPRPATYRHAESLYGSRAVLELFPAVTKVIVGQGIIRLPLDGTLKASGRLAEVVPAEQGDAEMKMSRCGFGPKTDGFAQCAFRSREIVLLDEKLPQPEKSPIGRGIVADLFLK